MCKAFHYFSFFNEYDFSEQLFVAAIFPISPKLINKGIIFLFYELLLPSGASCSQSLSEDVWVVVPESILFRMVRAHLRKPSSTFSPVRALVSRNISSARNQRQKTQNARMRARAQQGGSCIMQSERGGWYGRKKEKGNNLIKRSSGYRSPGRSATPPGRSPLGRRPGLSCCRRGWWWCWGWPACARPSASWWGRCTSPGWETGWTEVAEASYR